MTGQNSEVQPAAILGYGTAAEHIALCKRRALAELDADPGPRGAALALASLRSDIPKHPETADHTGLELMDLLMFGGHLQTPAQVREWIDGIR